MRGHDTKSYTEECTVQFYTDYQSPSVQLITKTFEVLILLVIDFLSVILLTISRYWSSPNIIKPAPSGGPVHVVTAGIKPNVYDVRAYMEVLVNKKARIITSTI